MDTTHTTVQEAGWQLIPAAIPVMTETLIDETTHQTLLERSLQEHDSIRRRLAQK